MEQQEGEMQLRCGPVLTAQSAVPDSSNLRFARDLGCLIEVQNLGTPWLQGIVNQNQYFTLAVCLHIKA